MTAPTPAEPPPSPAQLRILLAVLVTATVVSVLSNSMVTVILTSVRHEFDATVADVGWVVTGFGLAFAVGTAFCGRASDVFGIRAVFCVGTILFIMGGLVAGFANGLPALLIARVMQGLGGAAVPALSAVTVARVLPAGRRGFAFGLMGTGVGVGQAMGPVLGGLVAQFAGWRTPFLATAVLTIPVLYGAFKTLPSGNGADHAGWRRLDLAGALLLAGAVCLLLVGVTQGGLHGFGAPASWGTVAGALVLFAAFALRIRTAREPFVPPGMFGNVRFVLTCAVGLLTTFCYLGTNVLVPQLVDEANGWNVGQIGLLLLPGAVAVATLSTMSGRLSDRVGSRPLVMIGLAVFMGGAFLLSSVAGGAPVLVAVVMLCCGIGFSFIVSPLVNAASSLLTPAESGVGLGVYQGAFFLGGANGAAILGAVLAAREGATHGWNPLHSGEATAYSDTLLVVVGVLALGLILSIGLPAARGSRRAEREPEQQPVTEPTE